MTPSSGQEPRIFCFINGGKGTDWVLGLAMAEDGHVLAQHISSNDSYARGDTGFLDTDMGRIKRKTFDEHYPDGWEVEWVDDPRNHEGLDAAYERNQELRREAERSS